MLTQVSIKDYKCFGSKGATFNLSKVNFIFGDNSAGKSTMLKFLEMIFNAVIGPKEWGFYNIAQHASRCNDDQICDKQYGESGSSLEDYATKMGKLVRERLGCSIETNRFPLGRVLGVNNQTGERVQWFFSPRIDDLEHYALLDSETLDRVVEKKKYEDVVGLNDIHKMCERLEAWKYDPRRVTSWDDVELDDLQPAPDPSPEEVEKEKSYSDAEISYINDFLSRVGVEYEACRWCDGIRFDDSVLHDKVYDCTCNLEDVGTGIRGLFWLAYAFQSWQSGILEVEEPDANVNERQIAALTRTMVEEALKREHGQLVVECHSKLVALQLAAMVRQGILRTEGPDANLSVMEVRKTPAGSLVDPVKISPNGNITWPSGFFPAEAAILRELYGVS